MSDNLIISGRNVLPVDGEAILMQAYLPSPAYFERLRDSIEWSRGKIKRYGREMNEARDTAWYGEPDLDYVYSGKKNVSLPWTRELIEIKSHLDSLGFGEFNSCLLNYYRDGNESIGEHADDERQLDANKTIASLSFGGTRDFIFRHRATKERIVVPLKHGDLLVMRGQTQKYWKHSLPKRVNAEPRINLTYRIISATPQGKFANS